MHDVVIPATRPVTTAGAKASTVESPTLAWPSVRTMIRFNAFVRLFSFGHYAVHVVFACAFCTVGLVALHRAFAPMLPGHGPGMALALYLLPSVVFWASGVIKESLLLFGVGLFLLTAVRLVQGAFRSPVLLTAPFVLVLLFLLKFYVLLSLVPAVAAFDATKAQGFASALAAMAEAAEQGRDSTIDLVARIGRSSRLGERSRGVLDAGATSCCMILTSLGSSIRQRLA